MNPGTTDPSFSLDVSIKHLIGKGFQVQARTRVANRAIDVEKVRSGLAEACEDAINVFTSIMLPTDAELSQCEAAHITYRGVSFMIRRSQVVSSYPYGFIINDLNSQDSGYGNMALARRGGCDAIDRLIENGLTANEPASRLDIAEALVKHLEIPGIGHMANAGNRSVLISKIVGILNARADDLYKKKELSK